MKKYLIVYLLFAFQCIYADLWMPDSEDERLELERKTLFISLGSSCVPAGILRVSGLRSVAFPLDWLLSLDNQGLIKAIQDGFENLINDDFLIPDNFLIPKDWGASLIHVGYHFEFVHEGDFFGAESEKNMQRLIEKYQRRIERFRKLDEYSGTIVFVRSCYSSGLTDPHRYFKCEEIIDISDEDSLNLYWALKNRFPNTKIKLVILNEGDPLDKVVVEKVLNDDLIKIRHGFQPAEFTKIAQFILLFSNEIGHSELEG